MANVQHLDIYAGEGRTLTLAGRDASNLPVNLTGKTIAWYVGRSPWRPDNSGALVTKAGTIVSASGGTFSVAVAYEDTESLNGDYEHMAVASQSGVQSVICQGRFRIRPVLTP